MDTLKPQKKSVKDWLDSVHYRLFESPQKTEAWIIILLIVLNITLRIPTTPSPVGVDTYKTVWEVKGLLKHDDGLFLEKGIWKFRYKVYYPSMFFYFLETKGLKSVYPFTDPFIYQLDYAIIHLVTSLDLMDSMLVICMLSGVLAFLTSYIMGRSFVENKLMVYVIAFTYSTAPTFLHASTWQGTFRTLFMAVFPLLFWALFKHEKHEGKKFFIFSLYLSLVLLSIHRMGLMIPLLFLSYFIVKVYIRAYRLVEGKSRVFDRILVYSVPTVYVLLIVFFFIYPFFSSLRFFLNLRYEYETGLLTEGLQAPRLLLNMVVDYFSSEGLLMAFFVVGFIVFIEKLRRPVKNSNYVFMAVVFLFYTPFLLQGEYMTAYMIPVFSILISLGVKGVLSFAELIVASLRLNYSIPQFILIALIVFSCVFSVFMNHWWTSATVSEYIKASNWMDERVKHAVSYFDKVEGRVLIPQFTNLLTQFSAMSTDYSKIFFGWENYGWSYHSNQNMVVLYDWDITYVVEYGLYKQSWTNMAGDVGISPLLIDLDNERDRVFSNGLIGIYDSRFDVEQKEQVKALVDQIRGITPGVLMLPAG